MERQKPNFVFTAEALIQALDLYGEKIFSLKADNIFIVEEALTHHPYVRKHSIYNNRILEIIHEHWLDLKLLPPWGIPRPEMDECAIIAKAETIYPDNIIVCIGTIEELSRLCRVYSNDEIINVNQLADYFA